MNSFKELLTEIRKLDLFCEGRRFKTSRIRAGKGPTWGLCRLQIVGVKTCRSSAKDVLRGSSGSFEDLWGFLGACGSK